MEMKIMIDSGAQMPTRAHETDAGYDLYAAHSAYIRAHGSAAIDTGVHIEIPAGMYGLVAGRSGLNFKLGVICPQGTIDSGFCGAIRVKLYNLTNDAVEIAKGDRIAQIIFHRHESPSFEVVDSFESTERGDSGFGDSGK